MLKQVYIPHLFGDRVVKAYKQYAECNWLICPVHHSISWPSKDVLIQYDGEDYFLRGIKSEKTNEILQASIVFPLSSITDVNVALKKVYNFSSVLSWFQRGYVDVVDYGVGPLFLYQTERQPFLPPILDEKLFFNCNFMPLIGDATMRKALALWRDGSKLEEVHKGYAFLSFYKVIESQFKDKKKDKLKAWIVSNLQKLNWRAKERLDELMMLFNQDYSQVQEYIFGSCRCAIAHASVDKDSIDPDDPKDKERIEKDLILIKLLAEKYIQDELCIPNELYENRDALEPIYHYFDPDQLSNLRSGIFGGRKSFKMNGIKVAVNCWPHDPCDDFKDLTLLIKNVSNGIISLEMRNNSCTMYLGFLFNFIEKKAHVDWGSNKVLSNSQSRVSFLEYQRDIIKNGIVEISFPNNSKVVCEIKMGLDINIMRSIPDLEEEIKIARGYILGR